MWGSVVANADGCAKTRPIFGVSLHVSRRTKFLEVWTKESLNVYKIEQLTRVHIWIDVDEIAAIREMISARYLADPAYAPETLAQIRAAIMQDASGMDSSVENLCTKYRERQLAYKEQLRKDCRGNKEQYDIMVSWRRLRITQSVVLDLEYI